MNAYQIRRERLYGWMTSQSIDAAYLTKDAQVRYLTGMPSDSVLVLFGSGKAVLLPWDINLANARANADEIIPYTDFDRKLNTALRNLIGDAGIAEGGRVEAPNSTTYTAIDSLREVFGEAELVCRADGIDAEVERMRAVKDDEELRTLRKAAELTNSVFDELEKAIGSGSLQSELDIALFLERRARSLGGEGTGFEPIVAGPERSSGIHAFPAFTGAPFSGAGCGIEKNDTFGDKQAHKIFQFTVSAK